MRRYKRGKHTVEVRETAGGDIEVSVDGKKAGYILKSTSKVVVLDGQGRELVIMTILVESSVLREVVIDVESSTSFIALILANYIQD